MKNRLMSSLCASFAANPVRFCDRAVVIAYLITVISFLAVSLAQDLRRHKKRSLCYRAFLTIASLTTFLGVFGALMMSYRSNVPWQMMSIFELVLLVIGLCEVIYCDRLAKHEENSLNETADTMAKKGTS